MKMGETRAKVRVHGTKGHRDLEMLVDTEALYTKLSPSLARELGITPDGVIKVRLADGTSRGKLGERCDRIWPIEESSDRAGRSGDLLLLGVTTLEALRLKVNPVDGKLEPTIPYLYAT
jgi:predicted aspartyl protease